MWLGHRSVGLAMVFLKGANVGMCGYACQNTARRADREWPELASGATCRGGDISSDSLGKPVPAS